tara:strand:- start:1069 stop:1299 length:231 start_codon:yes stop_codon:yes gene_type:complete
MVVTDYSQVMNWNPIRDFKHLYKTLINPFLYLMKSGVKDVKTLHRIIGTKKQELFKNYWNTPTTESTTIVKVSLKK